MSRPPIFVTARYRTGSTLLWNLFRQIPGLTTFYEPDHDNLVAHIQADTPVQESHRGVTSYWDEYLPLMNELPGLFRNEFGLCDLLLDSTANQPALETYLRFLITRSRPKRPVLQFNRMDFRLPWLKAQFPDALLIHLYRDPRDQWQSTTRHLPEEWRVHPDENGYDLAVWAVALASEFPFLVGPHIRHSYERHYLLWRLSYLMGSRCADLSLSFDEDFCRAPERGVASLLDIAGLPDDGAPALLACVEAPARTTRALPDALKDCEHMEAWCDTLLDQLGLTERFGLAPLSKIRGDHASAWKPFETNVLAETARLSGRTFSRLRSHYTDVVGRMRALGVNARNVELALREAERELEEWRATHQKSA